MSEEPTRSSPTEELGARCERGEPDPGGGGQRDPSKDRLSRLARTIEADVIPRLVQAHRPGMVLPPHGLPAHGLPTAPSGLEFEAFLQQIVEHTDAQISQAIARLRERGIALETLYLELFAPTARRLGQMWEDDSCDFSTVTVALGRLQRLLRELSPAFGTEVEHPANGRRVLFAQPRDEQHSFGLSMVAEFFRRDGWDVVGGVGGAVPDPARAVREQWVDAVGFSIGGDDRLPWLRRTIEAVRAASRNPMVAVLAGGPPLLAHPEWALEAGADATASSGKEAPGVAELVLKRGMLRRQ